MFSEMKTFSIFAEPKQQLMIVPPNQTREGYIAAKKSADTLKKKADSLRQSLEANVHEPGQYRALLRLIDRVDTDIQLIQLALSHQIQ